MNKKDIIFITSAIITITILIFFIINKTYAYEYTTDNTNLIYKENEEELEEDIKIYLNKIDNILIPNTVYTNSNILIENYEFLTYFAIDYILSNYEVYKDKITTLENFSYTTKYGEDVIINEYIKVEEIYKITKKYFNIDYYYITNKDVAIINDYISLTNYNDNIFKLEINDVEIIENIDKIKVEVNYENNTNYIYTFINTNNNLTIENIEVKDLWKYY